MKKWKKRLLIAIGVAAGLLILAPVANAILFRTSVPLGLSVAKWEGEWHSEAYPLVSGRIVAKLPGPIPTDRVFMVDTFVYYNLWSFYRPGGRLLTSLEGNFGESHSSGTNEDDPGRAPTHLTFKFKGGPGPDSHIIDYTATIDEDQTIIVGGFRSENPDDVGLFTLRKE
jgi:hypothetical protein